MGREPLPAGLPIALMTELAAGSGFYITMTKGVKGSLAGNKSARSVRDASGCLGVRACSAYAGSHSRRSRHGRGAATAGRSGWEPRYLPAPPASEPDPTAQAEIR